MSWMANPFEENTISLNEEPKFAGGIEKLISISLGYYSVKGGEKSASFLSHSITSIGKYKHNYAKMNNIRRVAIS